MSGLFFTIEGIDGTGKTTIATRVYYELKRKGYDVVLLKDPGTGNKGMELRKLLLETPNMNKITKLLLFLAARQELVEHAERCLIDGTIVICDRYSLSTRIYQGIMEGLMDAVKLGEQILTPLVPDHIFLLDCPVKIANARIQARSGADNYYDLVSLNLKEEMRVGYLNELEKDTSGAGKTVIHAEQSEDVVFGLIMPKILSYINKTQEV